jgi:two-component system, OmpR family, response regulator CiaR
MFIELGLLQVELETYLAWFDGRLLSLSTSQIELLAFLLANPGKVLSREELAALMGLGRLRSVDVLLCRLRQRVGRDFIRNVRKKGWIVDPGRLMD